MKKILTLSLALLLGANLAYAQQIKTLQDSLIVSQKEALALIKRMYDAKILSKAGKAHFEDMITSQEPEDLYAEYIEAYKPMSYITSEKEVLPKKRPIAVSEFLRRLSFIEGIYGASKEPYMRRSAMGNAKTEKFNAKIKGFCGEFLLKFLEDKPKRVVSLHQKLQEISILPTRISLPAMPQEKEARLIIRDYFGIMTQKVLFFETYSELKENQIKDLLILKNEGILTNSNYEKLVKNYVPYQLYSQKDILKYCEKATVIDVENLKNKADIDTHFFETIRTNIFPEIELNIIGTYKDTITTPYNEKVEKEYIQVMVGKQEYHSPNEYTKIEAPMSLGWVVYSPLSALDSEYMLSMNTQFFNDYLMDRGSEKRLYEITNKFLPERANLFERKEIAFILLDTLTLEKIPLFHDVHRNIERNAYLKNTLQRAQIKAFITQLSAIHLIKTTNTEEVVIKLIRDEARNYERILWALPNTIVELDRLERCYECEDEDEGQSSFEQYMADFAKISRQEFLPTEVKETKISDKSYKLSFVWKGKAYEKMMKLPARFFSHTEGMLEMTAWINDALQEQKATGKFYYVGKYSLDAIYLTPEQHSFLGKYISFQD